MIWKEGYLGNNAGALRVGELGDRLCHSCIYPMFFHLENKLMVGGPQLMYVYMSVYFTIYTFF